MPRRNVVFVSYSHKQQKFAEELETQLRVLEAVHPEIKVFVDSNIEAGEEWDQRIREQLDATVVGVFLFSPDLLLSNYVREVEIAEIHAAWKRGDAVCLPLWAEPVAGGAPGVRAGAAGATWVVKLGDFQGLNDLKKPLSSLDVAVRKQVIADAAAKIFKAAIDRLAADPQSRTATRPPAAIGSTVAALAGPRRLTINVGRDDGYFVLRYRDGAGRPFFETSTATNARLPHDAGEVQFERLFPGGSAGDAWKAVAAKYSGNASLTPAGLTDLEIRLVTSEVEYLVERYDAPSWNRLDLAADSGWTIHFARDDFKGAAEVKLPANFVLTAVVADRAGVHKAMPHARVVERELEAATGTTCEVRFTGTKAETLSDLMARPPHAVYVVGTSIDHRLDFPDGRLDVSDLAKAFSTKPPVLVLLNLGHMGRTNGLAIECQALSKTVPLVLLRDEMDFAVGCRTLYDLLLRGGNDVVRQARHRLGRPGKVWWNGTTYATATARDLIARRRIAKRLLDRIDAKRIAGTAIEDDLLSATQRSVVALLAYGREGSMVEAFGEQLSEHLRDGGKLDGIRRIPLRMEHNATWTRETLLDGVCAAFACEKHGLSERLSKEARKTAIDGRVPLLLDFGPRGTDGVPQLQSEDLKAWVAFCRDELPKHVPRTVAVATLLSVQVLEAATKLRSAVETLSERTPNHFRLRLLPELGHVPASELVEYLLPPDRKVDRSERWEYPESHQADVGRVAEYLIAVAKDDHGAGQFQRLVAEIERIEELGWATFFSTVQLPPERGDHSVPNGGF